MIPTQLRMNLIINNFVGRSLALAALVAGPLQGQEVERRVEVMGTEFSMHILAADRATALQASEEALRHVEAVEKRLSTWKSHSELSRLNASPVGQRFQLSKELERDLQVARRCWRLSGGAFDPGVGAVMDVWNMRGDAQVPNPVDLGRAVSSCGIRLLMVRDGFAVRLKQGLRIEEGGFGKGVALDQAMGQLENLGIQRAVLDLGGQVSVFGAGEGLSLDVADPRDRSRRIAEILVPSGSVATSGNSERAVEIGGKSYGHLIDPRTGKPAKDFGSVTVWSPSGVAADCFSTALFIMGPDEGLAWASEHGEVEALFIVVTESGRLRARATEWWDGRFDGREGEIEIEFFRPE